MQIDYAQPSAARRNDGLFAIALITAAATFPLIFIGGLVTSRGAGMSVPDWPNSYGYNMFTFPPSRWIGGIFFEHTHRLAGSLVGFLSIILVVRAWWTDQRTWVRWFAVAILAAVCIQGTLGGLRVILSNLDLAIVHGCAAQLFFCMIATYCLLLSPFWQRASGDVPGNRRIARWSAAASGLALLQLVIGAVMRHNQAGLAIPDFPLSYGRLLPPTHLDADFRLAAIARYGTDLGLSRVTLFQIWIHFAHRVGAILVTAAIVTLSVLILRRDGNRPGKAAAWILLGLLTTQITLGILTVWWRKPADIASLHVAVGSLILMVVWLIFVAAYSSLPQSSGRPGARSKTN